MFEKFEAAPPDPIFGLTRLFREDSRPEKINLAVGVYQDEDGKTPPLDCTGVATDRIMARAADRQYLPIDGMAAYNLRIAELLLGASHPAIIDQRVATVQTLGGTSALRVAAETLTRDGESKTIWMSDPTWGNHRQIFQAAGHRLASYAWIDSTRTALDFDRLCEDLKAIPKGDVVLLHGCCHNPTGVDPTPSQWAEILSIVLANELLPIFDVAYQGFAESIDEDAQVLRDFCDRGLDVMICNSFSKNFSLYNERVGGLTVCTESSKVAQNVLSQIKQSVRCNYSNPPHHGAAIVAEVLADETLRAQWVRELEQMRLRIISMREMFFDLMSQISPEADFGFVKKQRGMFSYTGLDQEQVERLRNEYSIYLLGSGRINLAGLTTQNVQKVCQSIAAVGNAVSR